MFSKIEKNLIVKQRARTIFNLKIKCSPNKSLNSSNWGAVRSKKFNSLRKGLSLTNLKKLGKNNNPEMV